MSVSTVIKEQLKAQRDKLLDLSGRNNLISFKFPIKEKARSQNYLSIVDESPEFIIDRLNLEKRFELDSNKKEEFYSKDLKLKSEITEKLPQYKDTKIQTNTKEPLFGRTCEKLYKKNKLESEERGLNSLCISVGFLQWYQEEKAEEFRDYTSPLILYPVQMAKERSANGFKYFVEAAEQDTSLNICLSQKMGLEYGFKFPELKLDEDGQPLVEDFFNDLNKRLEIRNREGRGPKWEIKSWSTLSNFSFRNISIWWDNDFFNKDKENGWETNPLEEKEILKDFISGTPTSAIEPLGNMDIVQDRDERDKLSAVVPKLIADADSTQYKVIVKALEGKNLIVQGPPGTGKSQTITNIIAALLEKNKRILFAADKRAALLVVKNRLTEKGLSHFTLDAHSKSKGNVIENIKDRLNTGKVRFTEGKYTDNFKQLSQLRCQLYDHVTSINKPIKVNNEYISIHDLIWQDVKNKLVFEDPKEIEFIKKAKEINIDLIDRAKRELVKPYLDKFTDISNTLIEEGFYEITSKKELPTIKSKLEIITNEANSSLTKYYSILEDLDKIKISWDNIKNIKDDDLNNELKTYKEILGTKISKEIKLNDITLEEISKVEVLVNKKEEKEIFLDDWIIPFVKSNIKFESLVTLLDSLKESFKESDQFDNSGEFINNLTKVSTSIQSAIRGVSRASKDYAKEIKYGNFRSIIRLINFKNKEEISDKCIKNLLETSFNNNDIETLINNLKTLRETYKISLKLNSKEINLDKVLNIGEEKFKESIEAIENSNFLGCLFDKEYRKTKKLWKIISKNKRPKSLELIKNFSLCQRYCKRIKEEINIETNNISLDSLKEISIYIKNLDDYKLCLRDIENNFINIQEVLNVFNIFKDINLNNDSNIVPNLDEFEILKELSLANAIEKSSSTSTLIKNKLTSLGDEPNRKIYSLSCKDLELIIDDLKEFKTAVANLKSQIDSSAVFNGDNLEFILTKIEINKILKLFGNLKSENFPALLAEKLTNDSINEAFLLVNQYSNIKNEQELFNETLEKESLSSFFKSNYEDRTIEKIAELNINEIVNLLKLLRITGKNIDLLLDFNRNKNNLKDLDISKGLNDIVDLSLESGIASSVLFDAALLSKLSEKISLESNLSRYKGETLNQIKKQFCVADKEFIETTSEYLNNKVHRSKDSCLIEAPNLGRSPRLFTEGTLIEHETKKTKKHLPLRLLFKQAFQSIVNLHPCIMMSPASAAQYLPKKTDIFDVLIIDEASQMKPEQAFSLIARSKQIIIVGDQKQLPPSSRFEKDYTNDELLEDDIETEYSESILELSDKVIGSRNALSLGWHYRSNHNSLIDFSNYYFYDNKLTVFASNDVGSKVIHRPVENSQYRGGVNLPEVKEVIKALKEQIQEDKEKSIIIATMNQQQESEVKMALDSEILSNKELGDYVSNHPGLLEKLDVKKLEDIQGDERDVVIISTVYGPDADGKVTQIFGDINKANGHRRLNVLFTRAKHKIILVTSLKSSNIKESKREGPQVLKSYLEYAETGKISDLSLKTSGVTDNPFEESIRDALVRRGFLVDAQVGSGGYLIDLAIRDPNDMSKYILAVECDGKAYHSSYSARSNDRLRQEVLESKGWNFFRIWSTDWFRDPISELNQLEKHLRELSEKTLDGGS